MPNYRTVDRGMYLATPMSDKVGIELAPTYHDRQGLGTDLTLNREPHVVGRQTYKERQSVALMEWQVIATEAAILEDLSASPGERFASD